MSGPVPTLGGDRAAGAAPRLSRLGGPGRPGPVVARRLLWAALAAAASAALSGCAMLSSQPLQADQPATGLLYHLPKAVLPVQLVLVDDVLVLRVQTPRPVPDPAQRYLLRHPVSAFSSDNVKIELDSSGLLLAKLTMDSTDQSLAALTQVLRTAAIGRTEALAAGEQLLVEVDIDPDQGRGGDNQQALEDLHQALWRQLAQWAPGCSNEAGRTATPRRCAMVADLSPQKLARSISVSAQPLRALDADGLPVKPQAQSVSPDCGQGICYRSVQPHLLRLQVGDAFTRSQVVMLPNGAPVVALPLGRAPFVKTEHTVGFGAGGAVTSVDTKRPSSALALLSWPGDAYKSFMTSTGELVRLRVDYNSAQVSLAESQLATAKKLKSIEEELDALKKLDQTPKPLQQDSKTESDTTPAAGNSAVARPLMQIELGERQASRPVVNPSGAAPAPAHATGAAACQPGQPCPPAPAASAAR